MADVVEPDLDRFYSAVVDLVSSGAVEVEIIVCFPVDKGTVICSVYKGRRIDPCKLVERFWIAIVFEMMLFDRTQDGSRPVGTCSGFGLRFDRVVPFGTEMGGSFGDVFVI